MCALLLFIWPLAAQETQPRSAPSPGAWSSKRGAELTWQGPTPPPPSLPFDQALLQLWQGASPPALPSPAGLAIAGLATAGAEANTPPAIALRPDYHLPGEFDRQGTLFLGCGELATFFPDVLADVVDAVRRHVDVAALVTNADGRDAVVNILATRGLPADAVRFVEAPHDTMWVRDYGPLFVRRAVDGKPVVIDADYERYSRPNDDRAPHMVASLLRLPSVRAPLSIEGGNLMCNGRGLCLTTTTLLDRNQTRGYEEEDVRNLLRRYFGAEETVFLEPLVGEPTGHVDMFAVFTDANTVVVGEYDTQADPANAAVLNRNAARLAQTRGPEGLLRVVRIPMPPREDESWRTYTNVVFANGVLLTPVYDNLNDPGEWTAIETYRRLLPGWQVTGIDVSDLIGNGGALHCISMNAPRLASWPTFRGAPRPLQAHPLGPIAARPSPRRYAENQ